MKSMIFVFLIITLSHLGIAEEKKTVRKPAATRIMSPDLKSEYSLGEYSFKRHIDSKHQIVCYTFEAPGSDGGVAITCQPIPIPKN